jgi:hypothetical protein
LVRSWAPFKEESKKLHLGALGELNWMMGKKYIYHMEHSPYITNLSSHLHRNASLTVLTQSTLFDKKAEPRERKGEEGKRRGRKTGTINLVNYMC